MNYLISQIAISLLLAGVVGGVIGWLLHRVRAGRTIDQLRGVISRQEQQVSQAKTEVTILTDDYDELRQRSQAQVSELQQEVRKLPALNQNLEKSQLLVRQLLQKHEAEMRDVTTEKDELREALKAAEAKLSAAPAEVVSAVSESDAVDDAETEISSDDSSDETAVDSDDSVDSVEQEASETLTAQQTAEELEELQSQLSDDEPGELQPLFDSVEQHDDLKQIFGIGPVTEKTLNKLGITSYSQLAELKQHDIEKIADALQIFPGRIERDDWVGGARAQLEAVLADL